MQNNDYVSREAVLKCIDRDGYDGAYDLGYPEGNHGFQGLINEIPAADVRPVVRGEWQERVVKDESPLFQRRFYCTACGNWQSYGKTDFCPDCGADMRSGYKPGSKEAWQSLEKAQEDFRKTAQVIAEDMRGEGE